jgi:hypothetical protein
MRSGELGVDVMKEQNVAAGRASAEIELQTAPGPIRPTEFQAFICYRGRRVP